MEKIIIAALAKNNVIGKDGGIPWHSKEELQYFKNTTMGFPIIMGRKTFESIGKPLKGRLNIVLSSNRELKYEYENVIVFTGLTEAYNYCEKEKYDKVFIIGGGKIYQTAIETADVLQLTYMNLDVAGDTYFPEIDLKRWKTESIQKYNEFEVHRFIRN